MGINLDDMKKSYCIGPEHVPMEGPIIVEISHFDSEHMPARPATNTMKAMPESWRHQVYFRGWSLPLRLNNAKIDALKVAGNTSDTDDLVGCLIKIQSMPVTKFGQTEVDVIILGVRLPPGSKPVNENQAFGPQALAARGGETKQLAPKAKDVRPIGETNAEKVKARLKLNNTTFDKCLAWLRVNERDVHDAMSGKEVSDIPVWVLDYIKFYLESLKTPPELISGPTKPHDPESDAPPPVGDIDVSF